MTNSERQEPHRPGLDVHDRRRWHDQPAPVADNQSVGAQKTDRVGHHARCVRSRRRRADLLHRDRSRAWHVDRHSPALVYQPAANYSGADSFTFRANDGEADSNAGDGVDHRAAGQRSADCRAANPTRCRAGARLRSALPGVLGNDTDIDSASLTAGVVTGPAHGTLSLASNGSFSYTPTAGYSGPDSFTYRASDGTASRRQRRSPSPYSPHRLLHRSRSSRRISIPGRTVSRTSTTRSEAPLNRVMRAAHVYRRAGSPAARYAFGSVAKTATRSTECQADTVARSR